MSDGSEPVTPPQDTGMPDSVETDPAALSSAEDLDEDRLRVDPLEEGIEPPEHWSVAERYATTPFEQRHGETLDQRVSQERPDVGESGTREEDLDFGPGGGAENGPEDAVEATVDYVTEDVRPARPNEEPDTPAVRRGQNADEVDEAGEPDEIRTPDDEDRGGRG
ncbi:hypothetical protein AB8O38_04530 [Saccharomonospora xinjiangensis]|uniref:hypothetical protein n=1 Tax=Saccharomonospora xinjiangensis TaxID=75294 RepID=UPI00351088B2